jgi:hypothetical protein
MPREVRVSAPVGPPEGMRGRHPSRFTRGAVPARLYRYWRKARRGHPGRRFRDLYDYRHRRRTHSGPSRWFGVGGGIALVVVGLAIGWLPGPGGFLAILGLALLGTEMRPLARLLDRCELLVMDLIGRVGTPSRNAKRMLVVAGAILAFASLTQLARGLFQ